MPMNREEDDRPTTLLIVDDDDSHQRLLERSLAPLGWRIDFAWDGVQAMELLLRKQLAYDVVLLDRGMPRMSGMEVLSRMKEEPRLRRLPVIMQTGSARQEDIREGIRAGAYYYLTKPYDIDTLVAMVTTAAHDFGEYRRLRHEITRALGCLTLVESTTLVIHTLDHARDSAAVLANACPDPASAVIGLTELLVNAVEHGNLGITYEEKTQLNARGEWEQEVERRMALPENAGKRVVLRMERTPTELRFTIRDQGAGFPWTSYLDVDPRRAFDTHGRGIAIARAISFDSIAYRGCGNEVVATVRLTPAAQVDIPAASVAKR
jgi:phosphoserine phosphatase RsbU/P